MVKILVTGATQFMTDALGRKRSSSISSSPIYPEGSMLYNFSNFLTQRGFNFVWLLVLGLILCSCGSGKIGPIDSGDSVSWSDIPQFKSITFAGGDAVKGTLWIVTVKGELLRLEHHGVTSKIPMNNEMGTAEVVSFIDLQRGWIVNTEGRVWRTVDGAQSWLALPSPSSSKKRFFLPRQLLFVTESRGWLIDNFAIWRTDDSGISWQHLLSTSNTAPDKIWKPFRVSFVGTLKGWVSCTEGLMLRTKNAGETWDMHTVHSGAMDIRDVQFINEQTGWIAGRPDGGIYKTIDGGSSWLRQFDGKGDGTYINSVYFVSETNGWAVGVKADGNLQALNRGIVLHTADGGEKWQYVAVGENDIFFDRVYFADDKDGWVFARDNVYQTHDAGQTWRKIVELPPLSAAP